MRHTRRIGGAAQADRRAAAASQSKHKPFLKSCQWLLIKAGRQDVDPARLAIGPRSVHSCRSLRGSPSACFSVIASGLWLV